MADKEVKTPVKTEKLPETTTIPNLSTYFKKVPTDKPVVQAKLNLTGGKLKC